MDNKKPTIVLLSGKSGSGKDFIANIMKQKLEAKDKKVLITHYADLLKYILRTFFDWDGQKDERGRYLLQHVGTDIIRKKEPDFWIDFIKTIIYMFYGEWDYILIPDARFENEINLMKQSKEYFNIVTVRIDRTDYTSKLTEEQKNHPSETSLDHYNFDYYIVNDGTPKVESQINRVINFLPGNRQTVIIDLDCTLFNTVKCITEIYDEDFQYYSDYKKIPWQEVKTWDFTELSAATPEYINTYFNQKRFFDRVEMYKDAKEVIDELSEKYNIVFVSHGYSPNLRLKKEYVKKHFPYAEFIGVNLKHHKDKSSIDMEGCIFIDDTPKNLKTSNAKMKICYGNYDWNSEYSDDLINCLRAYDWEDVYHLLYNLKTS